MSTDLIRYDLLVQEALKSVVRRVLTDATRDGLPGEHHFYISFRTDKSGVRISSRLRERYPEDMTIVLQHQFSGLTVNEEAFEVGLSFSGVPERLRIPFDAITGFFDPSVQFGLKFEAQEEAAEGAPIPTLPAPPVAQAGGRRKPAAERSKPEPGTVEAAAGDEKAEPAGEAGAEVVSLDAFRKKS
jgi:hypothetical protein